MLSRRANIAYFLLIFVFLFMAMALPRFFPFQSELQRETIMNENNGKASVATVASIFNNNLMVASISLIPYVGWGWLLFVMWNTGVVFASYRQPIEMLLINPFVYIELAIYSYVVLRSFKLVLLFKQRKTCFTDLEGKEVVRKTTGVYPEIAKTAAITFIVATVALLVSAFVEYELIHMVT